MKTQTERTRGTRESLLFLGSGFLLLLAVGLAIYAVIDARRGGVNPLPDDVREARQLLMEKFEGPGYFQCGPAGLANFPYTSVLEAKRQVPAVTEARKLPPEDRMKIDRLIDKMAEAPKSRLVSGSQINILQLNLAMDVMYSQAP